VTACTVKQDAGNAFFEDLLVALTHIYAFVHVCTAMTLASGALELTSLNLTSLSEVCKQRRQVPLINFEGVLVVARYEWTV
jgi:hypothetical protein